MYALEILFAIAVLYCVLYRVKRLAVSYNGIFALSEEFAMYALVMLVVFCVELDWVCRKNGSLWEYIKNGTGGMLSFFFILRTEHISCSIGAILIIIIWMLKQIMAGKILHCMNRKVFLDILYTAGVAIIVTICVHLAIKYVPQKLGTTIQYKKEILLTYESKEMIDALNEVESAILKGVVKWDGKNINMIRSNYIRRMNLLRNDKELPVFLKQ